MNWLNKNWKKIFSVLVIASAYGFVSDMYFLEQQKDDTRNALNSFEHPNQLVENRKIYYRNNFVRNAGWFLVVFINFLILRKSFEVKTNKLNVVFLAVVLLCLNGCSRPFKPVQLEIVESHEIGFLIPYLVDGKEQKVTENAEFFEDKLVFAQQVEIPQQWVPLGHEYLIVKPINIFYCPNGEWKPAATLIKVDTQPITREWTADPNSGTSRKNEAIWVMTSDQVEFSTGWNVTARIEGRNGAVQFLANYPNGSLEKVLDQEVHAKLQTTFALAVTDLPMETLRKSATPVIEKVTKEVIDFFDSRGIKITNLGITGGFVYKDKTIMDTLVKVFNAEQDKAIAAAATAAQEEKNKKILLEAGGKAEALLKEKEAESEGIKLVADAKFYELDKTQQNLEDYMQLKKLELLKDLIAKWDGTYPQYYMGNSNPNMLLQLPNFTENNK